MKVGKAWELRYDPRVRPALEKLRDQAVLRRLEKAALRLKDRPERGKLLKGYENRRLHSYRVGTPGGEYRILYQLRHAERIVFVILIGSRQEIYELLERKTR